MGNNGTCRVGIDQDIVVVNLKFVVDAVHSHGISTGASGKLGQPLT